MHIAAAIAINTTTHCVIRTGSSHIAVRRANNLACPTLLPRDRGVSLSVCVSVCLSVRDHIFRTTHPGFTKIFVQVTYGRGSVFLWQYRDMLCTSGFMDNVIFAHKPRLLDVAAQLKRSAHASLGLAIKCAFPGWRHRGRSLRSIALSAGCVAGVGWAMLLVSFMVSIYYNMIIAYILRYLFASFTTTLPWQSCRPDWTQYGCREPRHDPLNGRRLYTGCG